jgi:hypothetical protein
VPSGFKLPDNFKKFDGLQDPEDWLVDYLETVKLIGGTRATAMQSIQVHLSGAARSWIKKLPSGSIDSWTDFEDIFVKNFRSTCKKPATLEELRSCRQKHDESMRKYIQRWNIIKIRQRTYRMKERKMRSWQEFDEEISWRTWEEPTQEQYQH